VSFVFEDFMRDLPISLRRREAEGAKPRESSQTLISTFLTCSSCGTGKMSSIPMGAHAAFRVREQMNCQSGGKQGSSQNTMKVTLASNDCPDNPTKYTSKAMMAIWNMYNRYSVHNIKSNINSYDKA